MSEDLPAFGKPTRPASATVLSSRTRVRATPGSPRRANPGALRRAEARAALPRPPQSPAVEIKQRRRAGIDLDDHIAAAASVTPVRAAKRLELLPVDGGAAMAAVARLDAHLSLIRELSHPRTSSRSYLPRYRRPRCPSALRCPSHDRGDF